MFGLKKLIQQITQDVAELKEAKDKQPETIEVPVQCTCAKDLEKLVGSEAKLRKEIANLQEDRDNTHKQLKDAQLQYKHTIEDIKHQQALIIEKNALKMERNQFEAEQSAQAEIKQIRADYAKKLEDELADQRKQMQQFMQRVMDALPNVNVRLKDAK